MNKTKLLGIALGGHTTLDPANPDRSISSQEKFMEDTLGVILQATAQAARECYETVILTHGSGPQTGIIMERAHLSEQNGMHALPLRYASMDLIGSLGMTFQRLLLNYREKFKYCLGNINEGVSVVPTSFIVDPQTMDPIKPVGKSLLEVEAIKKREEGYTVEDRDGKGQRVLVPSPRLLQTLQSDIAVVLANIRRSALSIAGGTGGRALEKMPDGSLIGRDAVIDKDRAFAQIITDINRLDSNFRLDTAAILTDAPLMVRDFSKVKEGLIAAIEKFGGIHKIPSIELRSLFNEGGAIYKTKVPEIEELLANPEAVTGGAIAKLEAACQLITEGDVNRVIITNPEGFKDGLLEGKAATIVEA